MGPDRLGDWTIKHVDELVARGVYESDTFDLKEMLPPRFDDAGKHRLRKTCAAFANSAGGFLVFGVTADLEKPAAERIVGIDATVDFPAHFGNFPSLCQPAVDWFLKSLAMSVGSNRIVQVVHIPRSWKAPHAVEDGDGWVFPKRTSKGTETMSYSEVQSMFLGYYEKRLKLQLLRAELAQLTNLRIMMSLVKEETNLFMSHLPVVELRVVETVLSDTYSITHAYPWLLSKLAELRQIVRQINSLTEILRLQVAIYPREGASRVRIYGHTLDGYIAQIERLASEAIMEVEKIIGAT